MVNLVATTAKLTKRRRAKWLQQVKRSSDFSGENERLLYRFDVDIDQSGALEQPFVMNGRNDDALFKKACDKPIRFLLQQGNSSQTQRSTSHSI